MKGFRQKLARTKRPTVGADDDAPPTAEMATAAAAPAPTTLTTTATAGSDHGAGSAVVDSYEGESPEAAAQRLVKMFCMSEGDEQGSEVALLPSIVEAAESSPAAAAECTRFIRKFMYRDYWRRPSYVYNAIMLMRILVENPGLTFTRNMDKKFVDTVRDVLRSCPHPHIVGFVVEMLQEYETKGAVDEGIGRLVEMWQKEKSKNKYAYLQQGGPGGAQGAPGWPGGQRGGWQWPGSGGGGGGGGPPGGRNTTWQQPPSQMWLPQPGGSGYRGGMDGSGSPSPHRPPFERGPSSGTRLPKPRDLRRRLQEAKTTASVLADVVNTNTAEALLRHELVDDLSSRCRRATGTVLEYLGAQDPAPDNQEMVALLDAHEVLQQTLHHYHRAVLEARKGLGVGEARRAEDGSSGTAAAEMTPAGKGKANAPASPGVVADGASADAADGPGGSVANSGNGGGGGGRGRNGFRNGPDDAGDDDRRADGSRGAVRWAHDGGDDDDDDAEMMAAAIAASTAPGASSRPARRGLPGPYEYDAGGPASEAENPFADAVQAESSRSSSRARPVFGGSSSAAAAAGAAARSSSAAAAGGVAYAGSDDESDEEYLRAARRNKAVAAAGPSSSSSLSKAARAGKGPASSSSPPHSATPRFLAGGGSEDEAGGPAGGPPSSSSRAAVDAAAASGGQLGGGPVFRY